MEKLYSRNKSSLFSFEGQQEKIIGTRSVKNISNDAFCGSLNSRGGFMGINERNQLADMFKQRTQFSGFKLI